MSRSDADPAPAPAEPPVFAEPWQAEAFALAVHLNAAGAFSWSDWARTLGGEIAAAGEDDGGRYYELWLAALERLAVERGLVTSDQLSERKADWSRAYRETPHGRPVRLDRGLD